ncbi:MAG: hypothetical protein Q9181_006114 [Wetmoreana brouardii]
MPKILGYTPSWLSRPSPGFDIFASTNERTPLTTSNGTRSQANGSSKAQEYLGPRRTIAHRGTEVFVVVDNQVRWSDLSVLKDEWEPSRKQDVKQTGADAEGGQSYRVLRAPISEQIRQLSVSANGQFLAIATSHTVHVAILPASSAFEENTASPIKLKAHTLGPTTHVLSQSPVVSILWHPCGVNGTCLVTVTAEAVVRLWELDRSNRWSFDSPSLAIDLQKLDAATSQTDDVAPRRMDDTREFSADIGDIEVASACFGGSGSPDESAWSAMTLWVATNDGDVYALCPLLPSKWQPTATQLPSLSAAAMTWTAAQPPAESVADDEKHTQNCQYEWISDIDAQVPLLVAREDDISVNDTIYNRPRRPGSIPRLQGPFQLSSGSLTDFLDVSDIRVIPPKMDTEELMLGEDDDSEQDLQEENGGLSAAVACLLTTDGRVHLFLDLDGVEAQWLPAKAPKNPAPSPEPSELVLLEALDTLAPENVSENEWPTFSPDPFSRYSFFTTHSQGVYFFSLDPWINRLEEELQNTTTAGTDFRFKVLRETAMTLRERILGFDQDRFSSDYARSSHFATACVVFHDSDLGYFLLTSTDCNAQPHAATLDLPKSAIIKAETPFDDYYSNPYAYPEDDALLTSHIARSAYEPPSTFWNTSSLLSLTVKTVPAHRRRTLTEEIRLSAATLDLMTNAHRLVSRETHVVQTAAADLFNRCERMVRELEEQIRKVREITFLADELENGGGDDDAGDVEGSGIARQRLEGRVQKARDRQKGLEERTKGLKRKISKLGGRELSEREKEYLRELEGLERAVQQPEGEQDDWKVQKGRSIEPWWRRFEEVKGLSKDLVERANEVGQKGDEQKRSEQDGWAIPNEVRKRKVEQVQWMLERESALVDAVQMRFERLAVGVIS